MTESHLATARDPETRIKELGHRAQGLCQDVQNVYSRLDQLRGRLTGNYDGADPEPINKEVAPDYSDIDYVENQLNNIDTMIGRAKGVLVDLELL